MDLVTIRTFIYNNTNSTGNVEHSPPSVFSEHEMNISDLFFLTIPAVTILGNFLVIVAVLRFKSLQSAINFLILGLAVADLLVGLFVMPYAVYIHVQGGFWFLGSLMCNIYSASDVACSTASILLLTVISFDRYRAVTQPLNYAHKSHDTKRVIFIMIIIWAISLALASPIVLGVNIRPSNADPYECRFYNPIFSISSSVISFIIPCFVIVFIYIRIMLLFRQRQKIAKAWQQSSKYSQSLKSLTKKSTNINSSDSSGLKASTLTAEIMKQIVMPTNDTKTDKLLIWGNGIGKKVEMKKGAKSDKYDTNSNIKLPPSKVPAHLTKLKNSKNRAKWGSKAYNSYEIYANKRVNDNGETSKLQFNTSAEKLSTDVFPTKQLGMMNCDGSTSSSRQAVFTLISRNGFKNNEGSTIVVPQLEVNKISKLYEGFIIGSRQNNVVFDEGNLVRDKVAANSDSKLVLKGQMNRDNQFICEQQPKNKATSDGSIKDQKFMDKKRRNRWLGEPKASNKQRASNNRRILKKTNFSQKWGSKIILPTALYVSLRNGYPVEQTLLIFKKNRGSNMSAQRQETKNQRMEKRVTKTLGIVVGTFLTCWMPFFSMYVLSAVCTKFNVESCQLNFNAFFYTTWLGYMNSCINPIIYTIFNVEFRQAFKILLCGRGH